ncbi:hypothetical protein V2J09_023679 [Rumex salicifolius]
MAEGTRMKTMEENLRQLEVVVSQQGSILEKWVSSSSAALEESRKRFDDHGRQLSDLQGRIEENRSRMEDLHKKADEKAENFHKLTEHRLENLTEMLRNSRRDQEISSGPMEANLATNRMLSGVHSAPRINMPRIQPPDRGSVEAVEKAATSPAGIDPFRGMNRCPKIDFPVFDGTHPRSWTRKCEKYFGIFAIANEQKVAFAMMYMQGKADNWAQGVLLQTPEIEWPEFCEAACVRFGEKREPDVVEEFNKLCQEDSVEVYTDKFEELRAFMLMYNSTLTESYFISSYISGLKEEIRSLVKIGQPSTLPTAFEQARLHHGAVQAIVKLSKPSWKPHFSSNQSSFSPRTSNFNPRPPFKSFSPSGSTTSSTSSNDPRSPPHGTSSVGNEHRRTPGLCYKCGDKYFVGHRCRAQTLHSLVAEELSDVATVELGEMEGQHLEETDQANENVPEVYVHALTGSNALNTIKIQGLVKSKPIVILVDSGSTHNFLDPRVAMEVGFSLTEVAVMAVAVANGNKMFSHQSCQQFEWIMQKHKFAFDMRILKLGGCDMVLGVDWLRKFSPLTFDFKELKLSFMRDGEPIELVGFKEQAMVQMIKGTRLQKLLNKNVPLVVTQIGHCYSLEGKTVELPAVLVLGLPDFSIPFELETDACDTGIGAVLMQKGRPLAYISKALHGQHLLMSTYEKELLAILLAVQKWRHYLEHAHFFIRTDQQALRHLLDQNVTTHLQKKAVRQLLGLSYSISYKKGQENKVADALSRRYENSIHAISVATPVWMQQVEQSYVGDHQAQEFIAMALVDDSLPYKFLHNILRYKGRVYIGSTTELRSQIIAAMHTEVVGGHSGMRGTYQRIKKWWYNTNYHTALGMTPFQMVYGYAPP